MKMLVAGNGESAIDSEHNTEELMKRFNSPRSVIPEFAEELISISKERKK